MKKYSFITTIWSPTKTGNFGTQFYKKNRKKNQNWMSWTFVLSFHTIKRRQERHEFMTQFSCCMLWHCCIFYFFVAAYLFWNLKKKKREISMISMTNPKFSSSYPIFHPHMTRNSIKIHHKTHTHTHFTHPGHDNNIILYITKKKQNQYNLLAQKICLFSYIYVYI